MGRPRRRRQHRWQLRHWALCWALRREARRPHLPCPRARTHWPPAANAARCTPRRPQPRVTVVVELPHAQREVAVAAAARQARRARSRQTHRWLPPARCRAVCRAATRRRWTAPGLQPLVATVPTDNAPDEGGNQRSSEVNRDHQRQSPFPTTTHRAGASARRDETAPNDGDGAPTHARPRTWLKAFRRRWRAAAPL